MSRIILGIPVLLAGIVAGTAPIHAESRIWTNREGKTVSAELESYDAKEQKISLKLDKGKSAVVPVSRMSDADLKYLEDFRHQLEEAAAEEKAKAGKTVSYRSDGAEKVAYHVYYPTGYDPARPPAMIIVFSPGGAGQNMLNSIKSGCEKLGWIGVGCDTFRNDVDDSVLDKTWAEVLPHLEGTVKHDANLMYLGGMSGGASRAYDYSETTKRPWKGVLAFGGWLGGRQTLNCAPKMAVALVNGDKDSGANGWLEKDCAVMKKARCTTKTFPFPGGHVVAPPAVVESAMQWLKEATVPGHVMSKGKRSPTPGDPGFVPAK